MGRRAKWIVGVCTVGGMLLLPAAAAAVFPGENGKIAFVSGMGGAPNDDSGADVYILDRPGDTTPTPLTSNTGAPGQHRHPSWSPHLDAIAYARWESPTNEKVFIDFLDQPGIPQLRIGFQSSAVRDDRPAWSSDGKWIYYSRRGLSPATDDDIVRERADNSSTVPQILVGSGTAEYQPALAPGDAAMCFTRGPFGSATADVFTIKPIDLTSGTQTDLSDSSTGGYNCAYSPEGDKVAFVEGIFANGALRMKNSDDTGVSMLVTTDTPMHFDGNPDWAPKRPAFCNGKPASIAGTDDADRLEGTGDRNVVQGHKGSDTIVARRGDDLVCGSAGRDTLRGNKGRDRLIGGPGNDVLNGGPGRDRCKGGPGRDEKISC